MMPLFSNELYGEIDMGISLYDLGVKSYLQIIPAVSSFLEKGRSHFEENQRNLDVFGRMVVLACQGRDRIGCLRSLRRLQSRSCAYAEQSSL